MGLNVSVPGDTVTPTVCEGQPAASVIVIVAVAGVAWFLLPFIGVTVSVAWCVVALVVAFAVTVATVVSLDVALITTDGPGSVTVMFCGVVVPLKGGRGLGDALIGPLTVALTVAFGGESLSVIVITADPTPVDVTVYVTGDERCSAVGEMLITPVAGLVETFIF